MNDRFIATVLTLLFAACGIAAAAPIDNGDGTVTDTATKLLWQQKDDGTQRVWADGKAYCEGLTLAGHKDWRLPSLKELTSLADTTRHDPAIDPLFTGAKAAEYWTSTPCTYDPARRRYVLFTTGGYGSGAQTETFYVRCVRPAQ